MLFSLLTFIVFILVKLCIKSILSWAFHRYQTGALTPLIRWLSQGMQRAAAPPHPPRPGVRAENAPVAPPAAGQEAAIAAVAFAGTFFSQYHISSLSNHGL